MNHGTLANLPTNANLHLKRQLRDSRNVEATSYVGLLVASLLPPPTLEDVHLQPPAPGTSPSGEYNSFYVTLLGFVPPPPLFYVLGTFLDLTGTPSRLPSSSGLLLARYNVNFSYQTYPKTYSDPGLTGPVLKRCKTNNGGRQAQDEAFWGRFDKCLKEKIDDYGQNMKVGKYFCQTVQADWERFGKPSNTLLPALPIAANNNNNWTCPTGRGS
ncbi:hypothetical protein F5879DRAFT_993197 [Lentinula edodes]|nr:hypothetical protein F5879DRAFT_993197 [Lentinula edodes]